MKNKPLPNERLGEAAGTEQAVGFVRGLQKLRRNKEGAKKHVEALPLGTLESIGRRIMMDIMKAPPEGAPVPNAEKAEPADPESAPATRRGRARSAAGRRGPAREP